MSGEGGATEARHPTGLSWPKPPYQIVRGLKLRQRIAGWFLIVLCSLILVGMLGGYFGMTTEGRALLFDTALSLGLGAPLEGSRIEPGACDYYQTTGRYGSSGYDCELTVVRPRPAAAASASSFRSTCLVRRWRSAIGRRRTSSALSGSAGRQGSSPIDGCRRP